VSQYLAEGLLEPSLPPLVHKDVSPAGAACASSSRQWRAAENVWRGLGSDYGATDVVTGWMESKKGHRETLLDPNLTQVGVYCHSDVKNGTKRLMCSAVYVS
jgi:uncharacterized protein YkwD